VFLIQQNNRIKYTLLQTSPEPFHDLCNVWDFTGHSILSFKIGSPSNPYSTTFYSGCTSSFRPYLAFLHFSCLKIEYKYCILCPNSQSGRCYCKGRLSFFFLIFPRHEWFSNTTHIHNIIIQKMAYSSTEQPLKEFHPFPRLPVELRLKI